MKQTMVKMLQFMSSRTCHLYVCQLSS